MKLLQNKSIILRSLEPEDLNFLFETENNEDFWEISNTLSPFSKDILKQYLLNAHLDIFTAKQLRLVIVDKLNNKSIGLIDLFDFNPQNQRAGIGILILNKYRNNGFAFHALDLMINYAFKKLNLHQIYANIPSDNLPSINLFHKMNFDLIGIKKDWLFINGEFKDIQLYQLIKFK